MKTFLLLFTCLVLVQTKAQENEALQWINEHAIKIEDSNPDTNLALFGKSTPEKFEHAKIFGFGEATHHNKEFFDLKAKFFKHLVLNQHVKVFIMEESYPAEAGINEWISGGKGDAATIASNFSIVPWYCKEVINLLAWMRDYNLNKSTEDQIRFYGMDIQNIKGTNLEIRELIADYQLPVSDNLLQAADACANKKIVYNYSNNWADVQLPKLNEIQEIIEQGKNGRTSEDILKFDAAQRALTYLTQYTYYVQHHYSQDRDLKMYENVKWIAENKSKNGKAFIWAHNEHINNHGFGNYSTRKIYNLGKHLKEYYKDDYYSVGFDFGMGTLGGYVFDKEKGNTWSTYELKQPFNKTYAETLIKANDPIYFIDMATALDGNSSTFLSKKMNQLVAGGSGYNPYGDHLYKKQLSKMFDGLIFVKQVTLPNYNVATN
ncbi:MAG: erythromycin esterase family protein [Nonlabens sp.]|nr:erythromycin esterase family protein [Nonlabens sp.]